MRARHHLRQLPDGLLKELLDKITVSANTEDHDSVPLLDQKPAAVEPTYSIVELPRPSQDPDQRETSNELGKVNIRSIPDPGATTRAVQHEVV